MIRILKLTFSLLLFHPITGIGQADTLRVFYDANWNEVPNSETAEYYRLAYQGDDGFWHAQDFYKDGQLQMSGVFADRAMVRYHGIFEWFYRDGKLKQKATYLDGIPVGEDHSYYDNGQLDTYRNHDAEGKLLDEAFYKRDGSKSVLVQAEFPGGISKMYKYLKKNTRYPNRFGGGRILISFVVNTDGSIADIETLKWTTPEFVHEAVRVVENMPKWKPAMRDDVPVRMKYNLPINFRR